MEKIYAFLERHMLLVKTVIFIAAIPHVLGAYNAFRKGEFEFGVAFSILALLSLIVFILNVFDASAAIHQITLLALLASAVGIFYLALPGLFNALATIFGVTAFLWLMIEKLIED